MSANRTSERTPLVCTSCGSESPGGARFCMHCAAPLPLACGACGADVPKDARFCPQCAQPVGASASAAAAIPGASTLSVASYTPKHLAEKILHSRSALEGERKQVTVLFADVKGSLDVAEQLDPEAWHRILERFFEILTEGVHRFEGTVNQYTGDGIMALFGAPIAHEDHAQRACYSALALRDTLRDFAREVKRRHGLDFATRIGINSGEVVVGKIGDDLRMDYTAQGHTVGLAQRMESLASAGSIYLSEHTRKLVHVYFALDDLGDFTLKGATEPVHVYELSGVGSARTRFDLSLARGLSKFVGRTQEMSVLESALEQALAGHGQVFGVVADAGTGKSRLCFEFAEACRAKGISVRVTTGVAHGKAVPLLPVLEFYRGVFGITERDDARTARQKIAGSVVQGDESLLASLPLLFDFLGVPDPEKPVVLEPGPERQRVLLAILKRLTLARSRREPAVILFEDLHWIDDATGVFLENLVDAADASRTLLVVNFRPEYRAEWMRRSYYQQVALAPLDPRAFAEMLGEMLGADPSLRDLVARIHARSGGNPFFAEEIVLSLIESGALAGAAGVYRLTRSIDALEIPATVQLILAARIDRLGEREKDVLQAASVIGREFSASLLRRVAGVDEGALGDALRKLVQAEFLRETALYPEPEYAFKHPLTQEVALGSQLRERRARVHAAVAHALLEIHAGALDEQAALLAHHLEAAGDLADAARWHERAAAWLAGRDPHAERRHWERLLELAGEAPASSELTRASIRACTRLLHLGVMLGLEFARGEALYRRGRTLAAQLDDPNLEAGLIASFTRLATFSGADSSSREGVQEALGLMPRVSDPHHLGELVFAAANQLSFDGRVAEGLAVVDAALASSTVNESTPVPLARLLTSRGFMLNNVGHLPEAQASLDRAAELLADKGQVLLALTTDVGRVVGLMQRGHPAGSLERIGRLIARADEAAAHLTRVQARGILAEAHLMAGQPHEALALLDAAGTIASETQVGKRTLVFSERTRIAALLARGDVAAARAAADRLVAIEDLTPSVQAAAHVALAEVLIASDAAAERGRIEVNLAEADAIAQRIGSPSCQASVCRVRAQLARALGDAAGWERELREALRIYTAMDATGYIERIAKELAP